MKLACNIHLVPGTTYFEKLSAITRYGFEGVELRLLDEDCRPENLEAIEKAIDESNLKVASVVPVLQGFSTPLDSKENLEIKKKNARVSLDLSARFGAGAFITPEYKPQSPLPLWNGPRPLSPLETELLYSLMSEAADYAEKVNGMALLEPINRYETHYYFSIQDVRKVIDNVGSNRLKIVCDFFHMNLEEADIAESICNGAGYIAHVQLGDSNRLLPGRGHMNFVPGFAALNKIGYDRYMALECQIPKDPEKEFPECVRYLQQCLKASQINK